MPTWLLVALVFLATHRLTRLIILDEFPPVKVPRDRLVNWLDPVTPGVAAPWGGFGRSVAYLLGCPWCASAYAGALVVWLTAHFVGLPAPVLVWAAASTVTGLIANAEATHEQRHELNGQAVERGKTEGVRR